MEHIKKISQFTVEKNLFGLHAASIPGYELMDRLFFFLTTF